MEYSFTSFEVECRVLTYPNEVIVIVPDVAFHLVPGDTIPIDVATFLQYFFSLIH